MFAAASNDNLGKPVATPYKPTMKMNMDVSFVPIKQPDGNNNYVALVGDADNTDPAISESTIADTEFSKLYKNGEIYARPTPSDDEDDSEEIFSLGNDPVNIFYVGSVTVVGLYILYRILAKTK